MHSGTQQIRRKQDVWSHQTRVVRTILNENRCPSKVIITENRRTNGLIQFRSSGLWQRAFNLVNGSNHFGGTCCLRLQGRSMKVEATVLITTCYTTWHRHLEGQSHIHLHCSNLKPHIRVRTFIRFLSAKIHPCDTQLLGLYLHPLPIPQTTETM
jgi:hypothetical protein